MKKRIRNIVRFVLLAVCIGSTVLMLRQWIDNTNAEKTYHEAAVIARQPVAEKPAEPERQRDLTVPDPERPDTFWVPVPVEGDPVMEEMAGINLAALREENPDVKLWIRIPGTVVDYPVLQGQDNDFYLNHTWKKEPNSLGSIFLEYLNSPDLRDYNTIIYGHNMKNGDMFGALEGYMLEGFWKEHPYVYILSDTGVYRYEIFSFWQPEVDSLTYGLNPKRKDTKEQFLALALEGAWYDTGIKPPVTDRILTLSTCSGGGYTHRFVVQARLPMMEVMR